MYDCHCISIKGRDSGENDDYAAVDSAAGIFVIADGMGGRLGGRRASTAATERFVAALRDRSEPDKLDADVLARAISSANKGVRAIADEDPTLSGLGTTLSAVVVIGKKGKVIHIGDSRVYLFRDGELHQLTKDHTLTEELVERHHLSREGAKRHPFRNMLSRSVGTAEEVNADICDLEIRPMDQIILVTDGLMKALDVEDLKRVLHESVNASAERTCKTIIDTAMRRDPADDVTTIVARLMEDQI